MTAWPPAGMSMPRARILKDDVGRVAGIDHIPCASRYDGCADEAHVGRQAVQDTHIAQGSAGRGGRNRDRVAILLADSCGRGDWRGFRQGAWHLHCDGGDVARLAKWSRSVNVGVVAHAGPYFVARVGAGQACLVPDYGAVR